MMDIFEQWFMQLPSDKRSMVVRWQNHRFNALKAFNDGRMSKEAAQRIIAKCSERIEKIAKGAAVV